jgi:transcriptional regulator with GAF, ATPase, and Fis domain
LDLSVGEVAERVGYSSASTFSSAIRSPVTFVNFRTSSSVLSWPPQVRRCDCRIRNGAPTVQRRRRALAQVERDHIVATLHATNWVLGGWDGAAARLGLSRTTLISKMQRLGISGGNNLGQQSRG